MINTKTREMNRNLYFIFAIVTSFAFSACETGENKYDIPTTYNFDNVSYAGQTKRLDMMEEITTYIKTAHVDSAPALDNIKLKDMYGENVGNHFSSVELNSATNQLKNKTVPTEKTNFEAYMDAVASASQHTSSPATNGQAGLISTNDGTKYLLNANGVELTQIIEKGLMGACFYYQATAVYMGSGKMDVDNETVTPGEGTAMEHHFDEAFGYFGAPINFPSNTVGIRFWAKYANKVNGAYTTMNASLMDNFLKGRAAISNKDMIARDEAINDLRKSWEIAVCGTAIYYINNALDNIGIDAGKTHHQLSEAYAFIMSLKFGYGTGSISDVNVDQILTDAFGSADPLLANLYNVTSQKLENAKTALTGYITELEPYKTNFRHYL